MFDVGFSELVVIGVVALIVIGPERLPAVARTAGVLLGRLQRYVNSVKADISREIHLDELKKLQQQVAEQAKSIETQASEGMRAVESSLKELETSVLPTPVPAAAPSPLEAAQATEATQLTAATYVTEANETAAAQQLELGFAPAEDKSA